MELGRLYQKVLQHLYQCVMRGAATSTVGNYAFFGGGSSSSTYSSTVNAYSRSLTRSVLTSLSEPKYRLTATTVGNYALFGGGSSSGSYYSTVDTYNSSLTRSTATSLSEARESPAATTVSNYALFGGGYYGPCSTVDAYNSSLTRSTIIDLSVARRGLAATTVGSYALFGGGYDGSSYCSTLDYYRYSENNKTVYLYKGAKYKFQNMDSEQIYSSTMGSISIPTPATGYIKIKNTTIS